MKIISLNTWGGRVHEPFTEFIKNNQDIDIFCLQEIYHEAGDKDQYYRDNRDKINFNTLNHVKNLLPDHNVIYYPHLEDWWGLAMAIKKDINVLEEGEVFVHSYKGYNLEKEKQGYTAKNIQYIKLDINEEKRTVINFHGLWNGMGKKDTDERITQSQNIINFIKNLKGEVILCGDFNLRPDTESLKMLEDFGLRNLIRENNIHSTRTSHYKKEERFADYAFISSGVDVADFYVMPDEVSDHAALYLEIK